MTYLTPVLPVICVLLLIVAFGMPRSARGYTLRFIAAALFLWSWPPVAWLLSASLEHYFQPQRFPAGDADAIVVLAAGIHAQDPDEPFPLPNIHTYLRCEHAAWLYKNWRPLPVVVSGGAVAHGVILAEVMRRVIETEGVPASMIWVEGTSRSTFENARNSAALLRARGLHRVVLVSEGYDTLRALKSFQHAGLATTPSPCAFRMYEGGFGWQQFLPDASSILSNDDALHEWVGLAWYRISGKI